MAFMKISIFMNYQSYVSKLARGSIKESNFNLSSLLHYFYLIYCLILSARCIVISLAIKLDHPGYFHSIDPTFYQLNLIQLFDSNFFLLLFLIMNFVIYVYSHLTMRPNALMLALINELVLENREHFFALNPEFAPELNSKNPLKCSLKACSETIRIYNLIYRKNTRFYSKLQYFPNLSAKSRTQIIFKSILIDFLNGIFLIFLIGIWVGFLVQCWILIWNFPENFSTFGKILMFLDIAGWSLALGYFVQQYVYFVYTLNLISIALNKSFDQFNKIALRFKVQQERISRNLHFVYGEALKKLFLIERLNDGFISEMLCVLFLLNLPMNIYTIVIQFFLKADTPLVYYAAMDTMIMVQSAASVASVLPLLSVNEGWSRTVGYFPGILTRLQKDRFSVQKLKVMQLYGSTFHSSKAFGFAVGSLDNIARRSGVQFLLIYAGYIMFMIKFFEGLSGF